MAEQHYPNMVAELRRRLEVGGRYHAPIVFDVTKKQYDQLLQEVVEATSVSDIMTDHPRQKRFPPVVLVTGELREIWGVPVRVLG